MDLHWLIPLFSWLPIVCAKLYDNDIGKDTDFEARLWKGPEANTKPNLGGFLVKVRAGGAEIITCGGAYIRPLIVLSSASCVTSFRYQSARAYVMTTAIRTVETFHFALVETMVFPEEYVFHKADYNLAMIKINRPLSGLLTEFIDISYKAPLEDEFVVTYGWGNKRLFVMPPSENPVITYLLHISREVCLTLLNNNKDLLGATTACTYHPEDMENCSYDGGSPVTYGNMLIGIVSTGSSCLNSSDPVIYTDLSKLKDFITRNLENPYFNGKIYKKPIFKPLHFRRSGEYKKEVLGPLKSKIKTLYKI